MLPGKSSDWCEGFKDLGYYLPSKGTKVLNANRSKCLFFVVYFCLCHLIHLRGNQVYIVEYYQKLHDVVSENTGTTIQRYITNLK